MDVFSIRRTLIMQAAKTYIRDGLVLWLDGINKGNTLDTWIDLIGGHQFIAKNEVIFGDDYIELDGSKSQTLENTSFTCPSGQSGTIEVVLSGFTQSGNQIVFMPRKNSNETNDKIAFGLYGSSYVIWTAGVSRSIVVAQNGFKVISVNSSVAIKDGLEASRSTGNNWTGAITTGYIGKRSSGNYYTGKIHAIRIYNRLLTAEEMIYNQKIDNERFNLGLTI